MKINWGKGLIIFFIIFFAWVFFFIFFAMRQNIDLVSDDYYQKGAKYTEQININQRSAPYQDSLQINMEANRIKLELSTTVATGNDSVQLYFFRSSDKTKDLRLSFKKSTDPIYIEQKPFHHGRYQVFLTWYMGKEKYTISKTMDIE